MPEFLLFAGDDYYPSGGACDFQLRGSLDECHAFIAARVKEFDWAHITDLDLRIVECTRIKREVTWTTLELDQAKV